MAITINEFKLPITAQEACEALQKQTDSFGIFFDVERCYELIGILLLENREIRRQVNELACAHVNLDDKANVISNLKRMGVNPTEFRPHGAREDKLDSNIRQSILNNLNYSNDVHEFIQHLSTYRSNKRNKGSLLTFALLPTSAQMSKYNRRMSVAHPIWSILSTSRLAASDPGIQGIPRTMGDIVTEPKGYTLKRCDSGQIEPRINFSTYLRDELIMNLIMYYKDAYYGLLHFCQMTIEEEEACRKDFKAFFKPIEITDHIVEMRQNIKRLTNAGSYGSSNLNDINPALAKVYEMKIVKHPARLALERKVTQDVERGVDTFYSMFGTPVTPDSTEKYEKGSESWNNHLIRCGINNPVQTTASDLMMFSLHESLQILREAKDTHICFYKHDEACFYVSDEDMANGIGDKLDEVTAYNVKGWIPIDSESISGPKKGDYPSYIL
jgi:hypothetical protein